MKARIKGVTPRYFCGRNRNEKIIRAWQAQITIDGITHYLGEYPTIEQAHDAWKAARAERAAPLTSWTEARMALLRQLWADNLSATQIAEQLGGGITRNAVIGKVHRLGLATRPASDLPLKEANEAAERFSATVDKWLEEGAPT